MELKIDNVAIEKLVQEQIKVAVAAVLSQKSDVLVARLVDHALQAKAPNAYSSDGTLLDKKICEMIRDEAGAAVKEWLDTKRAEIRRRVFAEVSKKSDGLVAKIVEQLVLGLGSSLRVQAFLERQ